MKKKWIITAAVGLAVLYIAGPIIAGATRSGDREGPFFYPAEFHTSLYIIAHEAAFHEKPRQRRDYWMYGRPLFYGLPRRLRSESEREAIIQRARGNESPMLPYMIEMDKKANQSVDGTRP